MELERMGDSLLEMKPLERYEAPAECVARADDCAITQKSVSDLLSQEILSGDTCEALQLVLRSAVQVPGRFQAHGMQIHAAVEANQPRTLAMLLKTIPRDSSERATTIEFKKMGVTPLCRAVEMKLLRCLEVLVEAGADVNVVNRVGKPVIIVAMHNKREDLVLYLVEHGANLFASDGDGETVMHYAVSCSSNGDFLRKLCTAGGSLYTVNVYGQTPMDIAFLQCNAPALFIMTAETGQDEREQARGFYLRAAKEKWTVSLRTASEWTTCPVEEIIDVTGSDGRSVLHWMAANDDTVGMNEVLNAGFREYRAKDNSGNTPFALTLEHKSWRCAATLLKMDGAVLEDIDVTGIYHTLARENQPALIEVVREMGIPHHVNAAGQSAADVTSVERTKRALPRDLHGALCPICEEERELFLLDGCSHFFCRECLLAWVRAGDGIQASFKCPSSSCTRMMDTMDVITVTKCDNALLSRYLDHIAQLEMSTWPDFIFCPRCPSGGFSDLCDKVECVDCGTQFCGSCGSEHDDPTECLRKHVERLAQSWVDQNAKQCPKCNARTQHDGGCTHMACRQCRYEYCWVCLGPYSGTYSFDVTKCPCGPRS